MESIAQNWLWILGAVAVMAVVLFRGRHRGHGGFGHGGFGHGHGGRGGHSDRGEYPGETGDRDRTSGAPVPGPEAAIDPVTGTPVRTADALTSVYQGRVYYFGSKDSRDRFEASPQEFAAKTAGEPLDRHAGTDHATDRRPRRRRGGC